LGGYLVVSAAFNDYITFGDIGFNEMLLMDLVMPSQETQQGCHLARLATKAAKLKKDEISFIT
jgi:hypothetical protein